MQHTDTVSRLLTQIQDSQDRANSLSHAGELHDPETTSSSGASHVPSQPLTISSPRRKPGLDCALPHKTRYGMGTSGNVFESLPAREGQTSFLVNN